MKITLKNLIKLIVLSAWIFLSVSFHSAAQGQTVYKRGATQLESLLPPAPEAASAVRFVDVPFSHSQGLACLDIPVYTVKGRELSIPVSLSYASGGVKLDEVAGVAGLGWRLEAGGCVTRTVVDMPDEFLSAELSHGMPSQAMLAKLGDPDDRSSEKAAFLRDIVWHRTDVSLDRYSYNVCGLSGSFVILDDGSVFHLSCDGVGISYAGTPFTGVTAFTLTGPDGTVYVLDVTETGCHDGSGDSPPTPTSGQPDRWTATKGMQAHHIFPRKFEKYFAKRGIDINDPKYGVWMDERKHLSGANAYNKEWEAFFEKYSNATKEDIMKKAEELMQKVYGK